MCTVTVVPYDEGIRVVCNRDEQRARACADPPRRYAIGARWITHPVDPESGGTWIGVNDAGLVLTLLNRGAAVTLQTGGWVASRGLVIPRLLTHADLDAATRAALDVDPRAQRPFRIVGVQGRGAVVIRSDGRSVTASATAVDRPLLFTSSSLGDALVESVRWPLFQRMVLRAPDSRLDGQRRFHAHRWPSAGGLSVLMSRPDARTVSRSAVDVREDIRFEYTPLPDPDGLDASDVRGAAC